MPARARLPNRRPAETIAFERDGSRYQMTVGYFPDGRPGEVFLNADRVDSFLDAMASDAAIAISLALQYGAPLAGLLSPTLKTLAEIGYLDPAKCKITVLHILGNSQTSIGEVKAITDAIATSRYIAVANRINDTKYEFPAGSLDIPKLDERACESVDALSAAFGAYIDNGPSGVLSGYVKHWRARIFQQFDAAKLITLKEGNLKNADHDRN
jgi:hypothetical protein